MPVFFAILRKPVELHQRDLPFTSFPISPSHLHNTISILAHILLSLAFLLQGAKRARGPIKPIPCCDGRMKEEDDSYKKRELKDEA